MSDEQVTKSYLQETLNKALEPVATKAELAAAVAKLVTKEEFEARIETLATKAELSKGLTKAVEDMKHCFGIAVEQFRKDFATFHDAYKAVDEQGKRIEVETDGRFNEQDQRITIVDTDVYKINDRLVQAAKALGGSADESGTRVAESG